MKLNVVYGIPFTEITLVNKDKKITLSNALIDTGSASTMISTDIAVELDLQPSPTDKIHRVRGVGGTEYVYEKEVELIKLNSTEVENLRVQIGAMDYGFDISAIIGMDFLTRAKIIIDTNKLEIYSAQL